MKSLTKRVGTFALCIALFFAMIAGSGLIMDGYIATAAGNGDYSDKYYYSQLSNDALAEKFYNAFERLFRDGEFKKGTIQYDLIAGSVASSEEVAAYVNGTSEKLVKSYGAGRDAFYMDHPDLFYTDVFKTSISAGQKGQEYVAYLDSSRVLNTYNGSWASQSELQTAIDNYERTLTNIVTEAGKKATVKEKIEFVNSYIGTHNHYGYGTKLSEDGTRYEDTAKAAFIYTSYGALVNNESVCEGYAKSFKAALDRLGIPCVLVHGYVDNPEKGGYQPHMWNYVQVEGQWYMVDPTNNTTSGNKWLLVGGEAIKDKYSEDNVVSTSGYELRYPSLKPYNYGVDTDENGMTIVGSYSDNGEYGKKLEMVISFEGKSAYELEAEGKYLAYRYSYSEDNKDIWSDWYNCIAYNEIGTAFVFNEAETITYIYPNTEYVQFALIDYAPDESLGATYPSSSPNAGKPFYYAYNAEKLSEDRFIVKPASPYKNNGYQSYIPSPGGIATPSNAGDLPVDRTYEIKIVYNDKLELVDGAEIGDVYMDFVTSRGNDIIKEHASLTNFNWDGDKTITFTFAPSRMYIHNMASYYFTPVNLVGVKSKKVPDPVKYSFKGKSVVCSKVFNDGRLYMSVFGEPSLLDDSDLSVTDFKDDDGKFFAESQRSQLLLVASKPTAAQEQEMDAVLKQETGVKDDEIVSSSTYEIDLQICGMIREVPPGSYMQVAFGFPEGYSPDDAGTTFKIYHYRRDGSNNIIGVEEIPVIVTQYGLIAKVTSFSPFTIVQIKNSSAAVQNGKSVTNVYAFVNGGNGGTITTDGKSGITEVVGNSVTYDITANEGYVIGLVRLNGKVIDSSKIKNGKLTLAKNEIETDNMLEVTFVSKSSANAYASQGITLSYGGSLVPPAGSPYKNPNTAGIVIGVILGVLVLAGAGFAAWWFLVKNKKQPAAVGAKAKQPAAKTAASKQTTTAARKQTSSTDMRKSASSSAVKSTAAVPKQTTGVSQKTTTVARTTTTSTRPVQKTTTASTRPSSQTTSSTRPVSKTTTAQTRTASRPTTQTTRPTTRTTTSVTRSTPKTTASPKAVPKTNDKNKK